MVSYNEALAILLKQKKFSPIVRSVDEASGYVSRQAVVSHGRVPPFRNSAMDGFAVRRADLACASAGDPITLRVAGRAVAGDAPCEGSEGAWEIMTGAPVPTGYDCIVPIENVVIRVRDEDGNPQEVVFTSPVLDKDNLRDAGEDFMPGDLIVERGVMLTPFHLMALAAVGQRDIETAPKPNVIVFSTGKEVVDHATAPLLPGQIHNSTAPYLMASLAKLSVQAGYGGVIKDAPEIFEARIDKALPKSEMVISTGAVSAGRHDFVPGSLRRLGAEILFHKVAVRPGGPLLYARFSDGTHYFGLPGNPVSVAVGLRFFVMPLLRHLQGRGAEYPITARLAAPYAKKSGRRFFCKARLSVDETSTLQVLILPGQESFKISPLLSANCWAALTEDQSSLEAGDKVDIYPLTPEHLHYG